MTFDFPFVGIKTTGTLGAPRVRATGTLLKSQLDYIDIPVFNLPILWKGASEIALRYTIVTSKYIALIGVKPPTVNPNFVLCVAYVIGPTTYRFKLWENVGELLYYPLYDGRALPKTFRLEIWNTSLANLVSIAVPFSLTVSTVTHPNSSCCICNYTNRRTNQFPGIEACFDNQMLLAGWDPSTEYWSFDYCGNGTLISVPPPVGGYLLTPEGEYVLTPEGEKIPIL